MKTVLYYFIRKNVFFIDYKLDNEYVTYIIHNFEATTKIKFFLQKKQSFIRRTFIIVNVNSLFIENDWFLVYEV